MLIGNTSLPGVRELTQISDRRSSESPARTLWHQGSPRESGTHWSSRTPPSPAAFIRGDALEEPWTPWSKPANKKNSHTAQKNGRKYLEHMISHQATVFWTTFYFILALYYSFSLLILVLQNMSARSISVFQVCETSGT